MATATKKKPTTTATKKKPEVVKYRGSQLLRMTKYKTFAARVVIKPDEHYSFDEADMLISDFMKKKG